jgi:hypothetical protein
MEFVLPRTETLYFPQSGTGELSLITRRLKIKSASTFISVRLVIWPEKTDPT